MASTVLKYRSFLVEEFCNIRHQYLWSFPRNKMSPRSMLLPKLNVASLAHPVAGLLRIIIHPLVPLELLSRAFWTGRKC
ncbi:fungal specific transcription factor [Aspergillus luchuensis]|uniref:Fungal specific transcription factor n=1 Tax=Aspergillus kawachii TaxID=1069201 RepID=A0A146FFK0_ASPKA|nr:fungal specific transcription factor [Aspergillus luchuensis]